MTRRLAVLGIIVLVCSPAAAARSTSAAKQTQVRRYSIVITGSTHTKRVDSGNGARDDGQLTEDLTWSARWNHVAVRVTSSSFGDSVSLVGPRATFTSHFAFNDTYDVEGGPCAGSADDHLPGTVLLLGTSFVRSPRARFFNFMAQLRDFQGIGPDVDTATRASCKGNTLDEPSWVTGDKKLAGGVVAHRPTPYVLTVNFTGHGTNRVRDVVHALARGHALLLTSGTVAGTVNRICAATCTNSSTASIKMQFIPG